MSSFLMQSPITQMNFLILLMMLMVIELVCFVACFMYRMKKRYFILCAAELCMLTVYCIIMIQGYRVSVPGGMLTAFEERILDLPYSIHIAIFGVLGVLTLVTFIWLHRWIRHHINMMSIKEGSDKLPMGLCCYYESGRTLLVNYTMGELCRIITGEALLNAHTFKAKLISGYLENGCTKIDSGSDVIISLPDGRAYTFSFRSYMLEKREIFEMVAVDVTDRFELIEHIEASNNEINRVNARLEDYGKTITDIIREREMLTAKVAIHDSLGKALIAAKRYVAFGDDAINIDALRALWVNSVALLSREAEYKDDNDSFDDLYDAAEIMGLKLSLKSEIKLENRTLKRMIMIGARECITNAAKHGKATELNILVKATKTGALVEYTNNGEAPTAEINMGGGLSSLERTINALGGQMEIVSTPEFVLRLSLDDMGVAL